MGRNIIYKLKDNKCSPEEHEAGCFKLEHFQNIEPGSLISGETQAKLKLLFLITSKQHEELWDPPQVIHFISLLDSSKQMLSVSLLTKVLSGCTLSLWRNKSDGDA